MLPASEQLHRVRSLEEADRLSEAEQLLRQDLRESPSCETVHSFLRIRGKQSPGQSFVDIYASDMDLLLAAHSAGVRFPELVLILVVLTWTCDTQPDRALEIARDYLCAEIDTQRAHRFLWAAIDELYTISVPPAYDAILQLHETYQVQSPAVATAYERLLPFLHGAPGDLQKTYFATGRSDEWIQTIEALWGQLSRTERQELRPAYLGLMATGYQNAGRHEDAIAHGRKHLAYLRRHLRDPERSSQLAEKHTVMMAPLYEALGRKAMVARAMALARRHLARYTEAVRNQALPLGDGMSEDVTVRPYVNVGTGAIRCGRYDDALACFRMAESLVPHHLVVQYQLAGLTLSVENDRVASLRHLRQAVATGSARQKSGGELMQQWFRESPLFRAVQDDEEFRSAVGMAPASSPSPVG